MRTIVNLSDNLYRVTWAQGKATILQVDITVSGDQTIDEMADEVWAFYQSPTPRPSVDPKDYMTVGEYREFRKEAINEHRDRIINGGYMWNGNLYDSDDRARANVTSVSTAIANGTQLPANFAWRTIDNRNIPMSPQEVVGFGVAMMDWVSRIYAVSWWHKDTLDTLTDIPAIAAHDITVGWPLT